MIHLIATEFTEPELLELSLSQRSMDDDERLKEMLSNIPPNAIYSSPYGPNSCLASIGMSWWRDVVPYLDDELRLGTEDCLRISRQIISSMTPSLEKFADALGEGTEIQYCLDNFPQSNILRDETNPYTEDEIMQFCFELGQLMAFLHNHKNGIMVLP